MPLLLQRGEEIDLSCVSVAEIVFLTLLLLLLLLLSTLHSLLWYVYMYVIFIYSRCLQICSFKISK